LLLHAASDFSAIRHIDAPCRCFTHESYPNLLRNFEGAEP